MKTNSEDFEPISFEAEIAQIEDFAIIRIPKSESSKLSSRGIVMAEGTINGFKFQTELEPDGKGSHFLPLDKAMLKGIKAKIGDSVKLSFEPSKQWPEPEVPEDLMKALKETPDAYTTWKDITPMARWDWIRWIRSTKNPETRQKRIEVTFSKFKKGLRRPCCFNRSSCTIPEISKSGVLIGAN